MNAISTGAEFEPTQEIMSSQRNLDTRRRNCLGEKTFYISVIVTAAIVIVVTSAVYISNQVGGQK